MHDPLLTFSSWLSEAKTSPAISEPTAMTLATADAHGVPSARIVLLKDHSANGFTFYTNLTSRKSAELKLNPRAALVFYWMPLDKQVRIEGLVTPGTEAAADAYFATRSREKQLGAWASLQSQKMNTREDLNARLAAITAQYAGQPVPRPPHWGGWSLAPLVMEFWTQNAARLHEREIFTRASLAAPWQHSLLYP